MARVLLLATALVKYFLPLPLMLARIHCLGSLGQLGPKLLFRRGIIHLQWQAARHHTEADEFFIF